MKKSLALVLAMLMLVACLTGCGSSSSGGSTAEGGSDYPTKNVNVIVPFAAGGNTDMSIRALLTPAVEEEPADDGEDAE